MFTDIVGYTELTQKNEPLAFELLKEHRKIIRPIILAHGGIEVKTIGDAFLIEFPSVLQAFHAALGIQDAVSEYGSDCEEFPRIQVRIGIHMGDVIHNEGDVYGDSVIFESWLVSEATPGCICISQQVADQVRKADKAELVSLGKHKLKGLTTELELYTVASKHLEHEEIVKNEIVPQTIANRLAVLPLANISSDPSDEYFTDGLTEEIIERLSSISGLRVIARASIMRYKGSKKSIQEIGHELGVKSLLDGSVRRFNDRLRINVQLIEVQNGELVWSNSYNRQLEDVFAVQSQIAKSVAKLLEIRIRREERERIDKRGTTNMQAHNLYLMGLYHLNKRSQEQLMKGISFFNDAMKKDSKFALPLTGLSDSYCLLGIYGNVSPLEAHKPAKEYAMRAIVLDENLAEAHASLAHALYHYEWAWKEAEEEFKKALDLNPNYSLAHHWYSEYLGSMGHVKKSLNEVRIAQELNPLSFIISTHAAFILYAAGDYDAATDQLVEIIQMDKLFPPAHEVLGAVYAEQGKMEAAEAEIKKAIELSGGNPGLKATLAYAYAICGKSDDAIRIIDGFENSSEYVSPDSIAQAWSGLGERDKAFDWLERAYSARSNKIVDLKIEPAFYKLHSDPRFSDLLKRMNLR